MIRLVIAEDHPVVRAGLERLLAAEDDIEIVGTASDGAEAVALANSFRSFCVPASSRLTL